MRKGCVLDNGKRPNYAIKPTPELALRSNRTLPPARLIAALGVDMENWVFSAKSVVLEDPEGQSHFLGLADDGQMPSTYLILSKARMYDAQDRALGMDTYHLEFCGEEMSGYGGISEAELSKDRIYLKFDEVGLEFLKGLRTLTIGFSAEQVDFEKLKKVLSDMFGETSCAFRVAA